MRQSVRERRQTTEVAYRFNAEDEADFAHEFRDLDLPDVDGLPADTNSCWRSAAAIGPDGACWQVRDAEFDERRSEVCSRAWQAAWTLQWRAARLLAVEASIGRRFASSVEYQLRDGRRVGIDVPAGSFFALSLDARF